MNNINHVVTSRLPTAYGDFKISLYQISGNDKEHLAIFLGHLQGKSNVLVRIHSECFTGDVLASRRCDCGEQLQNALKTIEAHGEGVVIYLRQEGRGIGLAEKLKAYNIQDIGLDTVDANLALGHPADSRDYSVAASILRHLGIVSVRLLTNNPLKVDALKSSGIKVSARIPLTGEVHKENISYLRTKVSRMNHLLDLAEWDSPEPMP